MSDRLAFAAAHVAFHDSYADAPHSTVRPGRPDELTEHIDWETTLALRERLDRLGFGIAEAMDTAQRFELGWSNARELIRRTSERELANGFVAGAGLDDLGDDAPRTRKLDAIIEQARYIQDRGGAVVLLPLAFLTRTRASETEFFGFYRDLIDELDGPLCLHWLGEMFHPDLAGYFPGESFDAICGYAPEKVRGAKLSLLDAQREVELRRRLAEREQLLFTGDDFHFARLILGGDAQGAELASPIKTVRFGAREVPFGDFSHALLGVLDAVAAPMSRALAALSSGRAADYLELALPCEQLGRALFEAPTQHYKAGLAFLSWIAGNQPNPLLANHQQRCRDRAHYERVLELAIAAEVIPDIDAARARWRSGEELLGSA